MPAKLSYGKSICTHSSVYLFAPRISASSACCCDELGEKRDGGARGKGERQKVDGACRASKRENSVLPLLRKEFHLLQPVAEMQPSTLKQRQRGGKGGIAAYCFGERAFTRAFRTGANNKSHIKPRHHHRSGPTVEDVQSTFDRQNIQKKTDDMAVKRPEKRITASGKFSSVLNHVVSMDELDIRSVERVLIKCMRTESLENGDFIMAMVMPSFRNRFPDAKLIQVELDDLGLFDRQKSRNLMRRFWSMLLDERKRRNSSSRDNQLTLTSDASSKQGAETPPASRSQKPPTTETGGWCAASTAYQERELPRVRPTPHRSCQSRYGHASSRSPDLITPPPSCRDLWCQSPTQTTANQYDQSFHDPWQSLDVPGYQCTQPSQAYW